MSSAVPPPGASLVGDLGAMKRMNYEELYATDKRLRSGSYGTVYTCHHRNEEGKLYAVKIIDRQKIKKTDDDSVFREVSVLKEFVGVPNIIQLIDFFVGPERLFVVQVLATGGDVFDRLSQRRTYSEENARTLARVLLGAIDAMHHVQPSPVVHRDLKPENLLLGDADDDASILLADFGFARHVTGKGCTTRCGTPAFVAPEVVLGVPYGVSVDLWSIGCLLYMLIGGYPPFNGKHHRELFRKIRASDFVFHEAYFGKVSDSAKNVISSLLTVNRDLRWSARQCLDSDWFREPAENLSSTDLSGSLREIKRFKARRHWKAASVIINWAAAQPFWKPDMVSFSQQMTAWDKEAIAHATLEASSSQVGSQATLASFMSQIPRLRFEDVYELKTQIRKGSYAVVWQGVHRQSGEIFAVKVVQRNGLKPSDDAAVLNEVAIMQQLSGKKYFCQLMDFYEEKEAFYLVMEFMAGGDVFDQVVKKTHYTEKDARDILIVLLKATFTMHSLGIAHRDIKPQNLLLSAESDSDIKVADFGFARRVHTPCSLTSRMGTPTYVAPEILKNVPHDERVDLWSIGVVAFVLLVGYPPFLEDNQTVLFEKIRTCDWQFVESDWKHVSKDAREMVKGLLQADPKERWSFQECLRCRWIQKDPGNLSSVDLSASLGNLRARRSRLRSLAKAVIWMGRDLQSAEDVPTHAHIEIV